MNISEQVALLQQRLRNAQQRHTVAKIRAEEAAESARQARQRLEQEFGIVTAEDAGKLLRQYTDDLNATIAELEKALGEAEQ